MNYYNEIDPKAAAWIRELIKQGKISDGIVDERSVEDVRPEDLREFKQCHFFAGIGGWSYALRLAGWPDDKPVWTGSCPCQPFSAAGKGAGFVDERHLWPSWFYLIQQCQPSIVFGEQVASKAGLAWFDLVQADLEGQNYAVGAADLCAAGVGAPHIRQRLYFVADSQQHQCRQIGSDSGRCGEGSRSQGMEQRSSDCGMVDSSSEQVGLSGRSRESGSSVDHPAIPRHDDPRERDGGSPLLATRPQQSSPSFWSACDWLPCIDGKTRPVEPGTFPLAYGVPARVGRLRGYGNAIVPQVAQAFIESYMEARKVT